MPFKSEKQRRYMFKFLPDIAKRWAEEGRAYIRKKKPNKSKDKKK